MAHYYTPEGARFRPLKKDGTEYQRITQKMADEAGAVPGVTDILKFSGDKGWMKDYFGRLATTAAFDVFMAHPEYAPDTLKKLADAEFRQRSDAAADRGTEIHGLLAGAAEDMVAGKPIPDESLARAALAAFKELGIDPAVHKPLVEKVFYHSEKVGERTIAYGGTRDIILVGDQHKLIDWKTVTSPREPRIDELAQCAAYLEPEAGHVVSFTNAIAADVYISQEDLELIDIHIWSPRELQFGWEYFLSAYESMIYIRRFNEMMKE